MDLNDKAMDIVRGLVGSDTEEEKDFEDLVIDSNPYEFKLGPTRYITCTEIFDADKLEYVIEHFEEFKKYLRPFEDETYDPLGVARKILDRARHNRIRVVYRQNKGVGRFCAVGSISLQVLTREIRHTISDGLYTDIDIVNAHPVILAYLCSTEGFMCPHLLKYIKSREKYLKHLGGDRDAGKQAYLAITNGGNIPKGIRKTRHLVAYRDEMNRLHRMFASSHPDEFREAKEARISQGKTHNHEAAFMNILMCDVENKILENMYEYFGKPEIAVLCFDGIMLEEGKYDLLGCEDFIYERMGINVKLSVKPFESAFPIPKQIPEHVYPSLKYYVDFRNLLKPSTYPEWVEEWHTSIKLIENCGKHYYLTRGLQRVIMPGAAVEYIDVWTPVKEERIKASLSVRCNILNPYSLEGKNMYTFGTLGFTNRRYGEGLLTHLTETRTIDTYDSIDFYPFLKSRGPPDLGRVFNTFSGFPLESLPQSPAGAPFESSKFYNHLKSDFFETPEEFDHFLDHMADIVQDPAQIKGPSHLFYSRQGCGKGLLYKFISKILGSNNVVSIVNTDSYFEKSFNKEVSNKLLKVFEEVSEKGSAFKNHNRLKGDQTAERERIEPKGIDSYYNRHCARFWYFTNNPNSLYIENDDRRHTLHSIKDTHANNFEYFAPIWEELEDIKFLKVAFNFLAERKYTAKSVYNAFVTSYKIEQKTANLPRGIKFIIELMEELTVDMGEDVFISSPSMQRGYKDYCARQGCAYQLPSLITQLKKIDIVNRRSVAPDGSRRRGFYINPKTFENTLKKWLDDSFELNIGY